MSKVKDVAVVATEQAVAVQDEKAILAGFEKDLEGFGALVRVRDSLIKTSRLKLVQTSSKAFKSRLAEEGHFACDSRQISYGPAVEIIPILISESASLLSPDASGPICRTSDLIQNQDGVRCQACPHGEYWNDWGTKENKKNPGCKTSIDVICLVAGEIKPMELNFRKNNMKAGKSLVSLVADDPRGLPFGSAYTLRSKAGSNEQYEFKLIDPAIARRLLTIEELNSVVPVVKKVLESEKRGELVRDAEHEDDDFPI